MFLALSIESFFFFFYKSCSATRTLIGANQDTRDPATLRGQNAGISDKAKVEVANVRAVYLKVGSTCAKKRGERLQGPPESKLD